MSRKEAQVNAWNSFRRELFKYAEEHPEYSLDDFKLQRADVAFKCWREARSAERAKNWDLARAKYLKAVGSLEQAEKLMDDPAATKLLYRLKDEYQNFAINRDPLYRMKIKQLLRTIKDNPGILQTEVYKGSDREGTSYALYFAAAEGLIRREEKGRSYKLFFVKDKEDMDTFGKLEDDEVDQEIVAKGGKGCMVVTLAVIAIAIVAIISSF